MKISDNFIVYIFHESDANFMQLGVYIHGSSPFRPRTSFTEYVELSQNLESAGYHSLWFADHLIRTPDPSKSHLFETWSLISALASLTESILLGTMVTPITFRNFGLFANTLTTIDQISSGRIILGLGTGWYEKEHHMFGLTYPNISDRYNILEEYIQALIGLLEHDEFSYDGEFIILDDAYLNPKPVENKIPILIGGGGEKRTLKLVAKYADYSNFGGDLKTIKHKLDVLKSHCDEINRDFDEISPTTNRAIILGSSASEVEKGISRYMDRMKELGWTVPNRTSFGDNRLVGTIDEVVNQIGDLSDIGVKIVNLTVNDTTTKGYLPDLIDSL